MSIVVNSTPLISLLIAKEKGYIREVKPSIEKLISYNRHINRAVYDEVLRKAEELLQ
ncbi:MAG: DUF3368 domain-containing protein [Defluviitaleaceae bacterium]|nr:DUF3368 domain-containing protein [Defluviitaleaceae bacterium]